MVRIQMLKLFSAAFLLVSLLAAARASAQKPIVLERRDATVTLEAYAPNIVRITHESEKRRRACAPRLRHLRASPPTPAGATTHTDKTRHVSLRSDDGEDARPALRPEQHEIHLRHLPVLPGLDAVDAADGDGRPWQNAARNAELGDVRPEPQRRQRRSSERSAAFDRL